MTETSATQTDSDKPFQIRISQIDYTVVPPSAFDRSNLPRVPVIRVYGQSTTGKSTCVHIHQVYPYIFLEYPSKIEPRHGKSKISEYNSTLNYDSHSIYIPAFQLAQPCSCPFFKTSTKLTKIAIRSSNSPGQGGPFLRLPHLIFTLPQSPDCRPSSSQSNSRSSPIRVCNGDSFSCLRIPSQLHPPVS